MELVVASTTFLQSKIAPLKSNMVHLKISPWSLEIFVGNLSFSLACAKLRYILQLRNSPYMDVIIWMGWLDENIDIERCGFCCTVLPMLQSRETYLCPLQNSICWLRSLTRSMLTQKTGGGFHPFQAEQWNWIISRFKTKEETSIRTTNWYTPIQLRCCLDETKTRSRHYET